MANKRPVTHFQTSRDLFILDTNEATACYYATSIGEIYRPTSLMHSQTKNLAPCANVDNNVLSRLYLSPGISWWDLACISVQW